MINNKLIAKFTQLFAESMLIYFILIPFFAIDNYPYPFWSYILLTVTGIILFESSIALAKSYVVYIPIILILFAFMYFGFHYPITSITIWLALITWRNASITIYGLSDNQTKVLTTTIVLLLPGFIFFNHSNLIWIAIVQVIVTLFGYWAQILIDAGKHNRTRRTAITLSTFGILILAAGGLIYAMFPAVSSLVGITMAGVGILFKNTVSGIFNIADWMGIDLSFLIELVDEDRFEQASESYFENMDQLKNNINDAKSASSGGIEFITWWTISIAVVALILIGVFLYRKKFADVNKSVKQESGTATISVAPIQDSPNINVHSQRPGFFTKSTNPIRKKVLKFEEKAYDNGLGRKPSETIEDWFARLDVNPGHLDLYQKIRYGNKELTQTEKEQCYKLLDELMARIDNQ